MPSADPPSVVHSLAVSQVPKKTSKKYFFSYEKKLLAVSQVPKKHSLPIGMIYQPIRVEDEAGVHGSLGNVTMEKSEN